MESMSKPLVISLKPFKLSDVDDFIGWAGDDEVARYCRWNTYTNRDDAVEFLREMIESHPWYRAICADDRPIGSIFVMPGTGKDKRRGEIGYSLSAKYWGRGIATEVVKLAMSCVFKELKCLDRVEGLVFAEIKLPRGYWRRLGSLKRDS